MASNGERGHDVRIYGQCEQRGRKPKNQKQKPGIKQNKRNKTTRTLTETKNASYRLISRMDIAKQRISDPEIIYLNSNCQSEKQGRRN